MSQYLKKVEEAKQTDLSKKRYLTDVEAAVYVSLGRTTFIPWAKKIGCRRQIGRRVVNDRSVIDRALQRGDVI